VSNVSAPDGSNAPDPRPGLDPSTVRWGADGLVAVVAQSVEDGRVLMLAWQDREALDTTLATNEVHFHSRSRNALWRKGETSGNVLRLVSAELDCDGDAILLHVDAVGPTCHTGARSCFDVGGAKGANGADKGANGAARVANDQAGSPYQGFDWLEDLWSTIEERARTRPPGSYTAKLLDGGVNSVSRKVGEEALEVVMAAKDDATAHGADHALRDALSGEISDLLYHLLVLMQERGLEPRSVMDVLRSRHAGNPGQPRR
jgi:phosphoribosyl-ATP pyrophosphohydrolase/phosphoribosyl-AMP cyclohydrolase